jgi:alpha-tubulin suppressor-like RCC1 family protein
LAPDGKAYCSGANSQGQLGTGEWTGAPLATPQLVTGNHTWRAVTTGIYHSCGLTTEDTIYCWGYGIWGQLGTGTFPFRQPTPVLVEGLAFQSVMAEHGQTCGQTVGGDWYCWGLNRYGQLGTGSAEPQHQPDPQLVSVGDFESLMLGALHTCGQTTAGDWFCWGHNNAGQLGGGYRTGSPLWAELVPQPVSGDYRDLAPGFEHTCGLSSTSADVYCWGFNYYGQSGSGSFGGPPHWDQLMHEPVADGHEWRSVTAGAFHNCGLTIAGEWYCWGYNRFGSLGTGSATTGDPQGEHTPQLVTVGSFESLSPGTVHTCGVTVAGEVYCWGGGGNGQLGNGTIGNSLTAAWVMDLLSPPLP